jgi:hypothetical protein
MNLEECLASVIKYNKFTHYFHNFLQRIILLQKRPLGRPRRRWVDNFKIDLREIGWDGTDWIDLAQDRDQWWALVNTVVNLRFHKMLGSSRVAVQLAAPQEGFSSLCKYII